MANRYSTNYRMNHVLRDDCAALVAPIDHGLAWGRVLSLKVPVTVMKRLISVDITGFMVSIGIVKQSAAALAKSPALARGPAIEAGAQGVVVGRKIWQRPEAEASALIRDVASVTRKYFERHW